jgi:hypothetical protein
MEGKKSIIDYDVSEKEFRVDYSKNDHTIHVLNEGGLLGTCSLTLFQGLRKLCPGKNLININWSHQASLRDAKNNDNIYPEFFTPPTIIKGSLKKFQKVDHNCVNYSKLDFTKIGPYVDTYFTPTNEIKKIEQNLMKKHELNPKKTLVIYYRGTDKWTEVIPLKIELFIKKAKQILEKEKDLKVLIQTDDYYSFNKMKKTFGQKAIYFNELPLSKGPKGIHLIDPINRGISNQDFTKLFLATTLIMSKCKYVLSASGNVSLWIALFRGTANNMIQFVPTQETLSNQKKEKYKNGFQESECELIEHFTK